MNKYYSLYFILSLGIVSYYAGTIFVTKSNYEKKISKINLDVIKLSVIEYSNITNLTCDSISKSSVCVNWWKNNSFHKISNTLDIINVTIKDDSDIYICDINGVPRKQYQIDVQYPARVLKKSAKLSYNIGSDVTIRCLIDAKPPATNVSWKFNDTPLILNKDYRYIKNDLHVIKMKSNQEGIYKCTPFNIHGNADSLSINVTALKTIKITHKPDHKIRRYLGDPFEFYCKGSSSNHYNLTNIKVEYRRILKNSTKNGYNYIIKDGKLKIGKVRFNDSAIYECIIYNELESISIQTELQVLKKACLETGVYYDEIIMGEFKSKGPEECKIVCRETERCKGYAFNFVHQICQLNSKLIHRTYDPHYFFEYKNC